MSKEVALIVSIVLIAMLLVLFVVSFVLYKRMPVPKGCENLEINEENCANCQNKECALYKKGEEK